MYQTRLELDVGDAGVADLLRPDMAMASKAVLQVVLGDRVIVYVSDMMTVSGLPEQAGCLTHRI